MVERPIPQDILKYKQKALGNFSARELILGAIGGILTIIMCMGPCKHVENISYRVLYSAIPAIPFWLVGFVKIYGVPLEKCLLPMIIENFINPPKRLKEIHDVSYEKRQKTRYWLLEQEETQSNNKKKKQKQIKPSTNGKKLICQSSKTIKGIK